MSDSSKKVKDAIQRGEAEVAAANKQSERSSKQAYERNKRGKVVLKVALTSSDDASEWAELKEWLKSLTPEEEGKAEIKKGLLALYRANKN